MPKILKLAIMIMLLPSQVRAEDFKGFRKVIEDLIEGQKSETLNQLEIQAARDRFQGKKYHWLPSVSASATHRRGWMGEDPASESQQVSVDATWNLFRFGADRAATESRSKNLESLEYSSKLKALSAQTKAAQVLLSTIMLEKELDVLQSRSQNQRQTIVAAEQRWKRGILSEQELTKLRLDASTLDLEISSTRRKEESARQLLVAYGGSLPKPVLWPITLNEENVNRLVAWVKSIQRNSVKLKALEAESLAAKSSLEEARRSFLPSLDFSVGVGRSQDLDTKAYATQRQAALSLSWPIFSKFSDVGEYRARLQEKTSAEIRYELEQKIAPVEQSAATAELLDRLEEARLRQSQIKLAQELYNDNLKRFERGLVSVNELSIDESRLKQAELSVISVWGDVHERLFKFGEMMGISLIKDETLPF